tara:strand:- start:2130 stop:3845 length:1716 start_codon:yes stop_codon:yes gene_type:complete
MNQLLLFTLNSLKEINPLKNIKILHTNIRGDILAGITVAVIALPLALAFGEISQLGPEAGIWSAIIGGIIGGLFGGCIVGVSGPTAPMASQIAVFMGAFIIGGTNNPDLVAAFSIIFFSGLIMVGISLLRISRFIHYVPYSVIAGFMCGIGVIIILSQINPFVGLEAKRSIHEVLNNFGNTIQNINIEALYVSIPSLVIIIFWNSLEKKIKILANIPSPLVALVSGSSIAYFMNLDIAYIGQKMSTTGKDEFFSFYLPDLSRIFEFIGPAFSLAGLAILDSLLSCKVADNMTGTHHNSDRETFGQGMANMAAGLFGGISTATATTQTVGNITFGARTPLSTIVKGLTLLFILFGFGNLVASIPNACLAAILFKLGIDILDYRIMPILRKLPKIDLFIFIVVLFITVYKDLMIAVSIGVIFSILRSFKEINLITKSSFQHKIIPFYDSDFISIKNNVNKYIDLPVSVLQPQGPLFFGSVQPLINTYSHAPHHEILVIDMSGITMIDLSGSFTLEDLINNIKSKNIKVFISNVNDNIKYRLEKMDFFKHVGINSNNSKSSIASLVLQHYNKVN